VTEGHTHGADELCEAGLGLYSLALRVGHVRVDDIAEAPCLVDLGLLEPEAGDLSRLRPVAPSSVLHRLLRRSAERIADERRREERLETVFAPLMRMAGPRAAPVDSATISVVSGFERINLAIAEVMAGASREVLAIQPRRRNPESLDINLGALRRDQDLLDRGGRIRTLYPHALRHQPAVLIRYEQLRGDAEARTLDEVTDRLIVIDRTVAFVPANADRTMALEVRHPALITHFLTTFDRLWHLATPMYPEAVRQPSLNGITPRQRAIAGLLVEGHTDAVIADRLGMNIRTARVHIAKLAATLGSESRAQLGYLIAESGILKREGAAE
jgi:DNA-binding CsgD family transcriptional regulator/sugar-specific transcriptional regulator TrmB